MMEVLLYCDGDSGGLLSFDTGDEHLLCIDTGDDRGFTEFCCWRWRFNCILILEMIPAFYLILDRMVLLHGKTSVIWISLVCGHKPVVPRCPDN